MSLQTRTRMAGPGAPLRALGLGLVALAALATGATLAASPAEPVPAVEVTEAAGVYRVSATFTVDQPPRAALAALTDYPGIPRFMPDIEHSTVVARRTDGVVVEQAAMARFLIFTRRIHLLLDIAERPGELRFRDTCGQSFLVYDGSWTVTASSGRTVVAYTLTAQPAFEVPEFVLRRLLKRDAVRMIARLRTEIAARAARPLAVDCQSAACQ